MGPAPEQIEVTTAPAETTIEIVASVPEIVMVPLPEIVTATLPEIESLEPPAAGHMRIGHPPLTMTDYSFWHVLTASYRIEDNRHKRVTREINRYTKKPRDIEAILNRGKPYLAYIYQEIEQRGFPAEITLLPFVESGFDPFAYSHGRAAGLWQFIPGTAKLNGLKQDWWYDGRRDVIASTRAALNYLDWLLNEFEGDWLHALAAYNSGSGTVKKAIKRNIKAGKPTDFWHLKLPVETSVYVPRLLAICAIAADPDSYGVQLPPLGIAPMFTVVDTNSQLDIAVAADLAGIGTDELYQLNPGYNRWATHPEGPHRLAIPHDKSGEFTEKLAALSDEERIKWIRHKIKTGETLSQIARHHNTHVNVLRSANKIKGSNIRAGHHLLVPVAAGEDMQYGMPGNHLQSGAGSKIIHKVRNGDSLWTIARRYDVSVKQLIKWNRLDSGSVIKPGQKIILWKQSGGVSTAPQIRTIHYTVRKGDSLYGISRKYNVDLDAVRRWNDLSEGKHLQTGQKLKLHIDVTTLAHNSES
ncbi:MAG: LysM peptidoglycan-binding domain-containing protein [Gammaproteobacteria bacterium]